MTNPFPNHKIAGRRRIHNNLTAAETGAPTKWFKGNEEGGFAFITAWLRSIIVQEIEVDTLPVNNQEIDVNGVILIFKDAPTLATHIQIEATEAEQATTLAAAITANSDDIKYEAEANGNVVTCTSTEYLDTAPIVEDTDGALIITNVTPAKSVTLQSRTYNEIFNTVCKGAEKVINFTGEGPEEIITQIGASSWSFTVKAISDDCRFDSTAYIASGALGRP